MGEANSTFQEACSAGQSSSSSFSFQIGLSSLSINSTSPPQNASQLSNLYNTLSSTQVTHHPEESSPPNDKGPPRTISRSLSPIPAWKVVSTSTSDILTVRYLYSIKKSPRHGSAEVDGVFMDLEVYKFIIRLRNAG
jgi:hypothetical protein